MIRIFLDESGDLGFSEKSSHWFIITIIITKNHRKLEKVIKKTHKGLRKKFKRVKELHAYNANEITRKRVLRGVSELDDCDIMCIILNKQKVYSNLRSQKPLLYNYTTQILLDRLHKKNIINPEEKIEIIIDERDTNKFLKANFQQYLEQAIGRWSNGGCNIKIKPSHTEKCLQVADFISWAIFRKFESNDYDYYEIIKNKIIDENLLYK